MSDLRESSRSHIFFLASVFAALIILSAPCRHSEASVVAYLEEFTYATEGGGYTVHNLSSRAGTSWKAGVPGEIGQCPSRPPRGATYGWPYSWGTAQNAVGYGNVITGSHYRYEHSYVQSPRIDLSAYSGSTPILSWTHFLRMNRSNYGYVEVSANDGFSWSEAYLGIGRATITWVHQAPVVLSENFATSRFRVRFRMYGYNSSSATTYNQEYGFYFDNVSVEIPDINQTPTILPSVEDGSTLTWPDGGMPQETTVVTNMSDGRKVSLTVPADTQMFKSGQAFSGAFQGPYDYTDWYYAEDYGFENYDDIVDLTTFLIGDEYDPMTFSKGVRLVMHGQALKQVGWSDLDEFHPITTMLPADDGALLDALGVEDGYLYLDANGDGVIDETDDLVVWTKHFTYFATYTPEPTTMSLLALGGLAVLRRRRRQ